MSIKLNQLNIEGQDPFLDTKKEKVTRQKVINLAIKDSNGIERIVKVQPVILPFYKDLTKKDIKLLGGREPANQTGVLHLSLNKLRFISAIKKLKTLSFVLYCTRFAVSLQKIKTID